MEPNITREMLIKILESLNIPFNEGVQDDESTECPRILFWDYVWEPISASGQKYNTIVTYQISIMNYDSPRNSKVLIDFKKILEEYNVFPIIRHEYVEKEQIWHSYFSMDILENL